ncbi:O-methyltransferase [Salinarimonas ramus]|uniref:O-methyltransferase n=1 Tax=Salinarimonas ramus TaxID=690164 RepID=A0A917Q4F0_9HYPH|nr:O-methyltransferase [Salinarimonas ramus]GGK23922.1 O-methyltransferase [Salinarimonas ramus]
MSEDQAHAVDDYLAEALGFSDPALEAALAANAEAGLPAIDVSPAQGKLLHLLARVAGARRILEIGTLGGYSTIWLARALPEGGRIVSLELEPEHAAVARENVARAGLSDRVEIRVGRALDSLAALEAEGAGPFDLVFVDADKPSNPDYLAAALRLSRPGTVLVFDNVVRRGRVVETDGADSSIVGSRAVLEALGREPRITATAIQTLGVKGWDGFALAIVGEG